MPGLEKGTAHEKVGEDFVLLRRGSGGGWLGVVVCCCDAAVGVDEFAVADASAV
jgi:hypothetical protein